MNKCKKCSKEFEPVKGLVNYCSLECRNSRSWSEEDKKKKSIFSSYLTESMFNSDGTLKKSASDRAQEID